VAVAGHAVPLDPLDAAGARRVLAIHAVVEFDVDAPPAVAAIRALPCAEGRTERGLLSLGER
jgi:hypothetical protein